jgi:hypothetical protein
MTGTITEISGRARLLTGIKHNVWASLPYMVFFAGSFAFFAFFADYVLFFQEKSSLFIFSEFPGKIVQQPGGFLAGISGFLTSFYYYPVPGSIVLSAIITLTVFVVSRCILHLSGRNEKIFPFIIGLLLFYLHSDYRTSLLVSSGILIQTLFFLLTVKTIMYLRGWLLLLIFPVLYFLTGGYSWIYLLSMIIYTLTFRTGHRPVKLLALMITAVIVVYIPSEFIFFREMGNLVTWPLILPEQESQRLALIIAAGLTVMTPLIASVRFPLTQSLNVKYSAESIFRSVFVLSFMLIIALGEYDSKNRHYFTAEKYFTEGKYDELVGFNTEHPSANSLTLFLNNIALCEKRLLNEKLFSFLQSKEGQTLFLKWEMVGEILRRGGYFYYSVGMINEAHRWAFENMVMKGFTPGDLEMLIKTELINGNYPMASKYISQFESTLFYRKDAMEFRRFLFNDSAIVADPELGEKRKTKIITDFFSITDDPVVNVQRIIASGSANRGAFDYLVAWLMLKKDYPKLASLLPEFEKYGYTSFPAHVEEVICMLALSNNDKLPDMGTLKLSSSTEKRWEQFLTVLQQYGSDPRSAEPALRKLFGNTFWYWAFYK